MKDKLSCVSQERSVLEEMVLDQIWALNEGGAVGLIKPHAATNAQKDEQTVELGTADALVASEWRSPHGHRYFSGDVVYTSRGIVGQISRFAQHPEGHATARLAVWAQCRWTASTSTGLYDTEAARVQYAPCFELRGTAIFSASGRNRTCIW